MASAKFQLSATGGISWLAPDVPLSSGLGLAQVGGNASVYARLASTAGVDTVAWSIVSASENAAELTLVQYPDKSVHILVPLDSAAAWLLRAVVNGGIDPLTKRATPELVSALAIKVLTAGGQELLAPGEGDEGDRAFGWTTAFNALASSGGGGGTATRIRADASAYLASDVTLASGTNVTLAQVGSTITINASGGGSALPSPWTATVDGGLNLLLGAPNTTGAGRTALIYAQASTTTFGGPLYLAAGGGVGAGFHAPAHLGWRSTAGVFHSTLRTEGDLLETYRTDDTVLFRVSRFGDRTEILTRSIGDAEEQNFIIDYGDTQASVVSDNRYTYFRWMERFTGLDLDAFSFHRTEGFFLPNRLVVGEKSGSAQQWSETAPSITTASTSPSAVVWSYPIPNNYAVSVTVSADGDNGTTNDEALYKAMFRRGAGSATVSHAAATAGLAAFNASPAHAISIALNGNTIEAKLVPGAATSTKWSIAVGVQLRYIG